MNSTRKKLLRLPLGEVRKEHLLYLWVALAASSASAGAIPSQPCTVSGANQAFLPADAGGHVFGHSVPLICGLPAAKDPVGGTGEDADRTRDLPFRQAAPRIDNSAKPVPIPANPIAQDASASQN